jgi:hypothetical protein
MTTTRRAARRLTHGIAAAFTLAYALTLIPVYYEDAGWTNLNYAAGTARETWIDGYRDGDPVKEADYALLDWCADTWTTGEFAGIQRRATNPTMCILEWSL